MRVSDYDLLFDLPEGEYEGGKIGGVRTVTIRAGRSLEILCHPIVRISAEARREAKARRSTPAMERLNAKNTERHIMRLIEANFTREAIVVTGTYAYPMEDYGMCDLEEMAGIYDRRGLPWDVDRIRKDVRNWREKLKRRVLAVGGRASDLKWIVRIEEGKEPPGVGLPPKYHFHAIVEGPGLDSETVKALWEEKHGHAHCDRLDLKDDGAARVARYLCKQRSGGRWWSHSRNLRAPVPRISDRKMSRRRMGRIAADVQRDGQTILESLYPGYKVVELPDVKYSDFVAGCYIYARMRRRD